MAELLRDAACALRDRERARVDFVADLGESRFAVEDPAAHAWQLAGVAPVTELDRLAFLRSSTMEELLESVRERSAEATESFRAGWA